MGRIAVLGLAAWLAGAQPIGRSRITFSGGWGEQIGAPVYRRETATTLGLSYGRRLHRYIEAEVGVFAAFHPAPPICSAHGCYYPDDRFLWVPFGLRFYAPVSARWLEISAGGGGLHENYLLSNPVPYFFGSQSRAGWGGYFIGEAAVSFDRRRRFWLGAAPRWFLANPGYARDRWFVLAGEAGWRF